MASPARAPSRRSAVPRGTAPQTTMSHIIRSACDEVAAGQRRAALRAPAAAIPGRTRHPAARRSMAPAPAKPGRSAARRPWRRYRSARAPAPSSPRPRRVCVCAAEVRAFNQQVGGEQQVFARAARAIDGAIVADPHHQPAARRQPPNPLGELPLVIRHFLYCSGTAPCDAE